MMAIPVTLVLSAGLCWLYLQLARRRRWLDQPNERSSHRRPTPHGGGVPLLLAFVAGLALTAPWSGAYLLLLAIALLLMLVGVIDDLWHLSVRLRMLLYLGCCLLLCWSLLPGTGAGPGWQSLLLVIPVLAMLWFLNLYNFMDGIDGIAAMQCILACGSAALLAWAGGSPGSAAYALFCLLLAAAHIGFLMWNWPPARLFMGDAGSIPTGFLLAGLVLLGAVQGYLNPACWLILLAVFITDASYTLLWRLFTGQAVTQPHRLHAYQRLSRHWQSHLSVDFVLLAINAVWLFPLAWAVQSMPDYALIMVILAYLPLVLGMAKIRHFA
jgi:Fuc2NAc and GlcNAc transferase